MTLSMLLLSCFCGQILVQCPCTLKTNPQFPCKLLYMHCISLSKSRKLCAGFFQTACVWCCQVDGVRNDKIQSIYLEDLPIYRAAFARGGRQVWHFSHCQSSCLGQHFRFVRSALCLQLGHAFWLLFGTVAPLQISQSWLLKQSDAVCAIWHMRQQSLSLSAAAKTPDLEQPRDILADKAFATSFCSLFTLTKYGPSKVGFCPAYALARTCISPLLTKPAAGAKLCLMLWSVCLCAGGRNGQAETLLHS